MLPISFKFSLVWHYVGCNNARAAQICKGVFSLVGISKESISYFLLIMISNEWFFDRKYVELLYSFIELMITI